MKSTVDEIRARFDKDVERFSNLQTGQSATIDAPLALELIAEAAAATTPRAEQRVGDAGATSIRTVQQDIRDADLGEQLFDVVVAAAVLHHLRTDDEWRAVFQKLYRALAPGGSLWIFDVVEPDMPWLHDQVWRRYAAYLEGLKGPTYRDEVLAYVEREDTPRPLMYQLDLLRAVGFTVVGVLHKHACFAAFGGVKR